MREAASNPAGGVDEFSPTVAPTSQPRASTVTEAATGVPQRVDEATDTLLGVVLAERYRVERRVGAGGMGAVYVGTHLALAKKVAVKVIQPRLGADPTIAQRFIQEARAASAIGHEHIVHITDFGSTPEGGSFLVMEYLDGEDLSETLRRDGPLPWQRVIHLGEQIAWALAAAHKNGIVHRDIKPANCYRVPREHDPDFIKVLDFGLAKVTVDDRKGGESLTNTGMLLGTPGYIAPELYRGLKADHRVDIYALGALMHKLLTGELPPMCGSDEGEPMRGLPAPDAVGTVLGKALRENPEQRWPTAQELAQALRAIPRTTSDEPTLLQRVSSGATAAALNPATDRNTPRPEPISTANLSVREPTPVSFSSLVSVQRDGTNVRLSLGIPALIMLLALVGGLVFMLTRRNAVDEVVDAALDDLSPRTALPAVAAPPTPPAPPAPATPTTPQPTPPQPRTIVDPPPATPQPPPFVDPASATPPVDTPPATPPVDTPPVDTPPATVATPPATPTVDTPPAKPLTPGNPTRVAKQLTRVCLPGSALFFEVKMSWTIDDAGAIKSVTLAEDQPNPLPKRLQECVPAALKNSKFAWDPGAKFTNKLIPIGKPPPASD